jgi:nucleoside-diphosphate-sugar epimerase
MKYPKLLITGSNGRIGRILTMALADSFDVYGLDIVGEQTETYYRVDISNYEALDSALKKIGDIMYVIHLAGDPKVKADWESVLKNNIIGTRNIYECAQNHGVKRIIFASSTYVTRGYRGIPPSSHKEQSLAIISTQDPIRPDTDYSTSKAFGETIARQYFESHGISSICLRIGAVSENDDPPLDEEAMKIWISHRDLIQLVKKSILSSVKFGIYYGVSNNRGRFYDIASTEKEIGYKPQDDASLRR